jgi:hypothetical protein
MGKRAALMGNVVAALVAAKIVDNQGGILERHGTHKGCRYVSDGRARGKFWRSQNRARRSPTRLNRPRRGARRFYAA